MNKRIDELTKKVKIAQINEAILDNALRSELYKVFSKDKSIQAIIKVQDSEPDSYQYNNYGDIEAWYCIDTSIFEIYGSYKNYLEEYINHNTCMYIDLKNETLVSLLGPEEIIINRDGEVFCSGNRIIDSHEYENEEDRDLKIELYMEKNGHYPNVFKEDDYGNLTLVRLTK